MSPRNLVNFFWWKIPKIPPKEDSRLFTISNFFEQWKICCSNWKFLLEMNTLVSIENETRSQLVSIDFHEFQIDGTITPTWKILSMKHKSSHAFQCFNFMLYLKSRSCGVRLCPQFEVRKIQLKRYNHVFHYPKWLENSFLYKNLVLNNKIFIVQKTKTCESSLIEWMLFSGTSMVLKRILPGKYRLSNAMPDTFFKCLEFEFLE